MGGGEVIREGWLVKSPPMEGRRIKAWRKRYFKLRSSKVLEYYKGEDGEILKGVINLEDCKTVHSDLVHKKYDYVFDIETKSRTYYLVAQTLQEMKAWVNELCRVCGLREQDLLSANLSTEDVSRTNLVYGTRTSSSLGPSISSPLQPTTSNVRTAATMSSVDVNRQLQPSEHHSGFNSMPRMVWSGESEVQSELGRQQEITAVPELQAIGTKISSISSANDVTTGNTTDSAWHEVSSTNGENLGAHNFYTSPSVNTSQFKPIPQPRLTSNSPLSARRSGEVFPSPHHQSLPMHIDTGNVRRAEVLENGYMTPRQALGRVPNYDYLPLGPPRPAVPLSSASTKQRNSDLLRDQDFFTGDTNPTYINIQRMGESLPPMVDRSIKPAEPVPRVDRNLKPKSNTLSSVSDVLRAASPPLSLVPATSPITSNFQVDSKGSNTSLNTSSDMSSEYPQHHCSNVESSSSEDTLSIDESDCPKPSSRTMHYSYTQVEFDKTTGIINIVDINSDEKLEEAEPSSPKLLEASKRSPVTSPRMCVSYMDVDIKATKLLAEEHLKRNLSLREAEHEVLQEKPYINLNRQGFIDDESDPDYYTYMRSFAYQEALKAYTAEDFESVDVEKREVHTKKQDVTQQQQL